MATEWNCPVWTDFGKGTWGFGFGDDSIGFVTPDVTGTFAGICVLFGVTVRELPTILDAKRRCEDAFWDNVWPLVSSAKHQTAG